MKKKLVNTEQIVSILICAVMAYLFFDLSKFYNYFMFAKFSVLLGFESCVLIVYLFLYHRLEKIKENEKIEQEDNQGNKCDSNSVQNEIITVQNDEKSNTVEATADEKQVKSKNKSNKVFMFFKKTKNRFVNFVTYVEKSDNKKQKKSHEKSTRIITAVVFIVITVFASILFFLIKNNNVDTYIDYTAFVICLLSFVLFLCVEKWWQFKKQGVFLARSIKFFMSVNKIISFLFGIYLILRLTAIYDATNIFNIIFSVVIVYIMVFSVFDIVSKCIRKSILTDLDINIPNPLSIIKGDKNNDSIIDYLEKNTGISMRSLWSAKYLKKIFPRCIVGVAIVLWISTSVVVVQPFENGAHYSLGKFNSNSILKPGIHLVLPYPFDEVKKYNVTRINKSIVGYESNESTKSNLWNQQHGGEEYKLLLGGGKELISVNLKLNYKINDLYKYLTAYSKPEDVLNAKAYELVLEKTVNTNADSILSEDRKAISDTIKKELINFSEQNNLGLEIVDVVVESIHPPIEIADTYQNVVSADVQKESKILKAQGESKAKIADAEGKKQKAIDEAMASRYEKISAAHGDVDEYNAAVDAYRINRDCYKLVKYLEKFESAFQYKKIYVLDDDINESELYINSKDKENIPN